MTECLITFGAGVRPFLLMRQHVCVVRALAHIPLVAYRAKEFPFDQMGGHILIVFVLIRKRFATLFTMKIGHRVGVRLYMDQHLVTRLKTNATLGTFEGFGRCGASLERCNGALSLSSRYIDFYCFDFWSLFGWLRFPFQLLFRFVLHFGYVKPQRPRLQLNKCTISK